MDIKLRVLSSLKSGIYKTFYQMNKQKPNLKWNREARSEKELSHICPSTHTTDLNKKTYLASLTGNDLTLTS